MLYSQNSLHHLAHLATERAILTPTVETTHSTVAPLTPPLTTVVATHRTVAVSPPSTTPRTVAADPTTPDTVATTVTPPWTTVASTHRTVAAFPPSTTPPTVAADDAISYDFDYVASGNSKNVLLAMATGLLDDKGNLLFDPIKNPVWKKCRAWKDLKPKKTLLRNEIMRRKEAYVGEGDCKVPHAQK